MHIHVSDSKLTPHNSKLLMKSVAKDDVLAVNCRFLRPLLQADRQPLLTARLEDTTGGRIDQAGNGAGDRCQSFAPD